MRRITVMSVVAFISAASILSCGGGGSSGGSSGTSWNSGSESNPTATSVDSAGNTVTASSPISPNAPVIAKATGLLQNGTYKVSILDPNGTALFSEDLILVTDGTGALSDTILSYLGNDAGNQGKAMHIKTEGDGSKTVGVNYKSITAGTYTAYFCKSTVTTCDATTASTSTTIKVDTTKPYVFATDSTGTDGFRSFLNGTGSIYASVRNATAGATIGLRIVSNSFQVFTDASPLPAAETGSKGVVTCTADPSGNCGPVLLWATPSVTLTSEGGAYDIVADVGNDGNWDNGTDFMDAPGYIPGFVIQDATPPTVAPDISKSALKVVYNGADNIADIACAADGSAYCTHMDVFSNLDIYGWLNPRVRSTVPHSLAHKFIILHNDTLANGDTLTPIQSFGYDHTVDPLQWGCTNEGRILLWPKATQVAGCYDVVMDVNQNGIYDAGVDIVDGYSGKCGFIIPGVSGAPTVTINSITDGTGATVAAGGTTSSSTATFNITVTEGSSSISSCQIRWAVGNSSNTATIDTASMVSGTAFSTQAINLFNGTNTILISCTDSGNRAGAANTTIISSNSATADIHFQASLTWQKPASGEFDMDLHVVEPGGAFFADTDCYYANCKQDASPTTTTGELLNVDCISQCTGPENIWMPTTNALKAGTYKVCVNPFSGEGDLLAVSIYNGSGSLIDTVTRASLSGTSIGQSNGAWYVGNYNCTAGNSGSCSWSRVDTFSTTTPCQ